MEAWNRTSMLLPNFQDRRPSRLSIHGGFSISKSRNDRDAVMLWCWVLFMTIWSLSLFLHMSYWSCMYIIYIYIYISIYTYVLVYTCLIFKVTYHLWFSNIILILHVLLTLQVPRSPAVFEAPSPRGCGKWCDSVIEEVSPRVRFFLVWNHP